MDLLFDFLNPIFFDPFYRQFRTLIDSRICSSDSHPDRLTKVLEVSLLSLKDNYCLIHNEKSKEQSIYQLGLKTFALVFTFHLLLFIIFGTICYLWRFDHALQNDKRFRDNQVRLEVKKSIKAIVAMDLITVPITILQLNGHSLLYHSIEDGPGLCHFLYAHVHKQHHRFIISTPFAAFAFHPVEAAVMSLPNLLVPFVMPMSKVGYLLLLLYGNMETIISHDSTGSFHTIHHLNAKSNFGQLTTFWDMAMGTYLDPHSYSLKHLKFPLPSQRN
ncbi:hypothetical protein F1880_001403 [Penicillium rolfsii]|nr:hypothetical protein F1880_001403 [Penicillium rolfsii]